MPVTLDGPSHNSDPGRVASAEVRSRPLVLVVEDDPDNAQLITWVLRGVEYDFLVTSTGGDALQRARAILPDAITLDLRLPDIDGLTLLGQLKSAPETHAIPVIVVSILADERDPRLATAFAVLSKPIDHGRLRTTVAAALGIPQ